MTFSANVLQTGYFLSTTNNTSQSGSVHDNNLPSSQQPHPAVASSIFRPSRIHATVQESETERNERRRKTARSAHKVTRRIPIRLLVCNPNPLRYHLTDTSTAVVECGRNTHGDDGGHVTGNPGTQWARAGEGAAGTQEKAAVSCRVRVRWKKTGCEPPDAADGRARCNVPSAGVEVVCTPAEEETDEVATNPGRHCRKCQHISET